jgi:Flp pilus assembly protein protease CpaA
MTVGGSIFLIAVGAILRYAVTASISGIDLATVGLILMIAGIVGLLIGLFMYANARRTGYPVREREYVDRDRLA